jgi:hypothetical protein
MEIAEYKRMRRKYIPEEIRLIFILESPPASGKYFYDTDGEVSEPLFKAMMRLLELSPSTKKEGLIRFAEFGFLIVDSIYKPVNQLSGRERDEAILSNLSNLIKDLLTFGSRSNLRLFLVKSNICRLLESPLIEDGFKIVNYQKCAPFPSNGHQNCFHVIAQCILESEFKNLTNH